MRSWKRFPVLVAVLVTVLLSLPLSSLAASVVTNGDFETGNLNGWTVVNQAGGSGNWFAYSGTTAPASHFPIAAPPQGTYAATADTTGPGSHILYQDLTLTSGFHQTLSLDVYYHNHGAGFASPETLDFHTIPNQQYRIDILNPSAPVDSVAASDILGTVFQTQPGDPSTMAPTVETFDLSAWAGQTVRLRLAEVDNEGVLLASADDIQVQLGAPFAPTTKDQCKDGGWQSFPQFKNQGDCVSYVATHGRNPGNG